MITLVVEASTYSGSAVVLDGATVIAERSVAMRGRYHEALMPAVAALLRDAGLTPSQVERVVCGAGPGAFTSLRVGASIAKGIAMGADAPLVPISSLALLVASQREFLPGRYLAAVDAMRGEHYVQLFSIDSGAMQALSEVSIVPSADVERHAAEASATAIGPDRGGEHSVTPQARALARITNMIDQATPADLAEWEPGYGRLAEAQVKWEAQHGRALPPR
ncbi:MAG: universal protein YeaZ [Gemmatimonadetes bacterium]|nr:universal protein YeaZ [Gemmatimonadota bacterium]